MAGFSAAGADVPLSGALGNLIWVTLGNVHDPKVLLAIFGFGNLLHTEIV